MTCLLLWWTKDHVLWFRTYELRINQAVFLANLTNSSCSCCTYSLWITLGWLEEFKEAKPENRLLCSTEKRNPRPEVCSYGRVRNRVGVVAIVLSNCGLFQRANNMFEKMLERPLVKFYSCLAATRLRFCNDTESLAEVRSQNWDNKMMMNRATWSCVVHRKWRYMRVLAVYWFLTMISGCLYVLRFGRLSFQVGADMRNLNILCLKHFG